MKRSVIAALVAFSLAGCGSSAVRATPEKTPATAVAVTSYCAKHGQALARSAAAGVAAAYPTAAGGAAAAAEVVRKSTPELTQACLDTAAAYKLGPNLTRRQIVTLNADENKS
jgi:hypothetical protein